MAEKHCTLPPCLILAEETYHGFSFLPDRCLQWARTMTWKAVRPIVQLLDKAYENGVRVAKKAFHKIEERLERHVSLPKYCVRIQLQGG